MQNKPAKRVGDHTATPRNKKKRRKCAYRYNETCGYPARYTDKKPYCRKLCPGYPIQHHRICLVAHVVTVNTNSITGDIIDVINEKALDKYRQFARKWMNCGRYSSIRDATALGSCANAFVVYGDDMTASRIVIGYLIEEYLEEFKDFCDEVYKTYQLVGPNGADLM